MQIGPQAFPSEQPESGGGQSQEVDVEYDCEIRTTSVMEGEENIAGNSSTGRKEMPTTTQVPLQIGPQVFPNHLVDSRRGETSKIQDRESVAEDLPSVESRLPLSAYEASAIGSRLFSTRLADSLSRENSVVPNVKTGIAEEIYSCTPDVENFGEKTLSNENQVPSSADNSHNCSTWSAYHYTSCSTGPDSNQTDSITDCKKERDMKIVGNSENSNKNLSCQSNEGEVFGCECLGHLPEFYNGQSQNVVETGNKDKITSEIQTENSSRNDFDHLPLSPSEPLQAVSPVIPSAQSTDVSTESNAVTNTKLQNTKVTNCDTPDSTGNAASHEHSNFREVTPCVVNFIGNSSDKTDASEDEQKADFKSNHGHPSACDDQSEPEHPQLETEFHANRDHASACNGPNVPEHLLSDKELHTHHTDSSACDDKSLPELIHTESDHCHTCNSNADGPSVPEHVQLDTEFHTNRGDSGDTDGQSVPEHVQLDTDHTDHHGDSDDTDGPKVPEHLQSALLDQIDQAEKVGKKYVTVSRKIPFIHVRGLNLCKKWGGDKNLFVSL